MRDISDVPLRNYLAPVLPHLNQKGVTELLVNRPGELYQEKHGKMVLIPEPILTFDYLKQVSVLVASYSGQRTSDKEPLLSAVLPNGERIQVVRPPACDRGTVALAIRKPSDLDLSLKDYSDSGAFDSVTFERGGLTEQDKHLVQLKNDWKIEEFIKHAVLYKKNIVLSGGTSTGKTTFLNSIVKIIPQDERIITIEDVRETILPHRNKVHLLYSKGGQGISPVTPGELLQVCLRLRPDRILPSEIRGAEAFDFLECINSGHPGSMTSLHSNSASDAEKRLVFMCMRAKTGLTKVELTDYIRNVVDVFIQFSRVGGKRVVTDIVYEPD